MTTTGKAERPFTVAVFSLNDRHTRFRAYTLWYNPAWKDCCKHTVLAASGTQAKKLAIAEHKAQCFDEAGQPKKIEMYDG